MMRIINIHKRLVYQPKENITQILDSLTSVNDRLWPNEQWPPMIFKHGLAEGAAGGHGPIKYSITKYIPGQLIAFTFIKPAAFSGIHKFEVTEVEKGQTEIKHTIDMSVSLTGIIIWYTAIKWLHDALLEDCLDKVENNFLSQKKKTEWNSWVRFLRKVFRRKKQQQLK